MPLAHDIGLASLPLGVERIEFLLEALVGRFSGVDRAAKGEPGSDVISLRHHRPPPLNEIQLPPEAEEPRARPAGAGDLSRDHGEGAVALAAPLDPVGMDENHVGGPAPLPHEPRAGPQGDRRRGIDRAAARRTGGGLLQLPGGGLREAAIRPLLKLINDPSDQEVAGEPHRRRHAMKPPPLAAQFEDGHLREPRERPCDIDRPFFHVTDRAAFRCGSGERPRWASRMLAKSRASFSPCPPGTRARCAAASRSPASFLRYWPPRIGSAG